MRGPNPRNYLKLALIALCLLTCSLAHAQTVTYQDGDNDGTPYTAPVTLQIDSGTATQSGVISGSGGITKSGDGTLNLTAANAYTGSTTVAQGTLAVSGSIDQPNAALTVSDANGYPSLVIQSGGQVTAQSSAIGKDSAHTAQATVQGAGSSLNLNGVFTVGGGGYRSLTAGSSIGGGTLLIQDGGAVTNLSPDVVVPNSGYSTPLASTIIGFRNGNTSGVTVSGINANGTASSLSVQGLIVGYANTAATATLTVQDGAQLSSTSAQIGVYGPTYMDPNSGHYYHDLGIGIVTISGINANGAASTWTNTGSLTVTGDTTPLTISHGGVLTTGSISINGTAIVTIASGGVLETGSVTLAPGTLNLDGGTVRATQDNDTFVTNFGGPTSAFSLASGGGTLDNGGYSITVGQIISGTGALSTTGSGTTTLTAANTYQGGTTVKAGTTVVSNNAALSTGAVNVTGGTLQIASGHTIANTVNLNGGSLAQTYASGTQLSTIQAYNGLLISTHPTTAQFLDGVTSADATITGGLSLNSTASNDDGRRSAVFSLSGLPVVNPITGETDTFVLQLKTDNVDPSAMLAYLAPGGAWINAVLGNFGGTPTFVTGAYDSATDFHLGYYGVDTADNTVWAVLNHNSDFAIFVPEPSTWALLGFGLAALAFYRRRRL